MRHIAQRFLACTSIVLMAAGFVLSCSNSPKSQTPPNVLIFMVDDIGQGDIGAYNPQNKTLTPNIDELAAGGVSFHHAHSPASVCAPTRYALLCGNYVYRGKKPKGTWSENEDSQILPGQETLADQLGKNGYHTAFYGKVHLGGYADAEKGTFIDGPFDHGFDYSLALPNGIQAAPYAFFQNGRLVRYSEGKFNVLPQEQIASYLIDVQKGKKMDNYSTESVGPLLVRDALRFLDDHFSSKSPKPFYMHFMSQAGHTPHKPPVAFNVEAPLATDDLSKTGAIPVKGITLNQRTDMVYESDVAIGLFVKKLKELGQLENTIIIYTSDNGVGNPENYSCSDPQHKDYIDGVYGGDRLEYADGKNPSKSTFYKNGQGLGIDGAALRGKKGYVYEGGHRIPFIWHWAGEKGANSLFPVNKRVFDQLISLTDVYRTICTLAGVEIPDNQALDSYDFSHMLINTKPVSAENPSVRECMAIQANRCAESVENNKQRYAWSFYHYDDEYKIWDAIISKRVDNKVLDVVGDELYQLTDDENQSEDIESINPEILKSLVGEYTEYLKKPHTHKGQLKTPDVVLEWMKHNKRR